MTLRRRHLLGAASLLAVPASTWAQDYPSRPVRLLVGFAPGGPTDLLARVVAVALGKALGQSVVVDNRAGAAGALAAQATAKADADGYTLLFAGDGQLTLLPQLLPAAGYSTQRDLAVVRTVAGQSNVLLAQRSAGITDMPSLLRAVRARPGKVSYGSAGNGTPSHLVGALFETATGTELLHVPYRGAGPAMGDFIGGRLDLMFVGMPVASQHAQDPKFVPLAVTGRRRSPRLPQVPTFAELGIAGLGDETDVWWALAAPAATPASVRARLDAALRAAMEDPQVRQAFETQGVELVDRDAAATQARIRADEARWAGLLKAGKVRPE
ncbi:Bug family tripartite tricarboxylate transporter substrate binding protein [Ramlibacter sp. MAHUQ-53]|uniref:Bug family tripartite tricarboxylate transporter substrate binding protein n=1 Tax=unclassified Ramlibacter TaxID=2617605 RepID=UPI00362BA016